MIHSLIGKRHQIQVRSAYLPTETLVVNIYKPPVYPIRLFCTKLGKLLAEINVKMPQLPSVILGDFNDNILTLQRVHLQMHMIHSLIGKRHQIQVR
jgi:hypothetical protein